MEDFLTVKELSERIKYSRQTLYNLICKRQFILGKHYIKPTPKKVLFKWSEVEKWLEKTPDIKSTIETKPEEGEAIKNSLKRSVMKNDNLIKV